jgi:hypothetical protein
MLFRLIWNQFNVNRDSSFLLCVWGIRPCIACFKSIFMIWNYTKLHSIFVVNASVFLQTCFACCCHLGFLFVLLCKRRPLWFHVLWQCNLLFDFKLWIIICVGVGVVPIPHKNLKNDKITLHIKIFWTFYKLKCLKNDEYNIWFYQFLEVIKYSSTIDKVIKVFVKCSTSVF